MAYYQSFQNMRVEMKKNIFLFLLLSFALLSSMYAGDKGRISLIMNGSEIDLPVNSVALRKENQIVLTARAELNNENSKQLVSLQLSFKSLSTDSIDVYNSFLIEVRNQGNTHSSREALIIRFEDNANSGETSYAKGDKFWTIDAISLRFDVSKVDLVDNHLIIQGTFESKLRSSKSDTPLEPVAVIKDGRFKIII
jgi:hypothetical protein